MAPCEIVPALADEGIYIASESTFYRVLREEKMLNHRGRSEAPKHNRPSTYSATAPNQVYMWDITYLNGPHKGMFYYLYLFSDLYDRSIVGWEVYEEESADYASSLIKRICLKQGRLTTEPLVLHSDNGSPMKGATMLATLYQLGITPSNSRPRVSNDNPYAESLFKTLKYRPNYQPKGFETLEEAREWVSLFVKWYNHDHHHSGLNFLTPYQRRSGSSDKILSKRKEVYEALALPSMIGMISAYKSIKTLLSSLYNFSFNLFCNHVIFCTDRNIDFDFRLSARRTHHNRTVIFQ